MSGVSLPMNELEFTYARSSGPGGQNVNKVNSKAVLRWNPARSQSLSESTKWQLIAKLQSKLTEQGDLVISSDRFRDQIRNRADCIERLQALIAMALKVQKKRKKTNPSRASQRQRMDSKAKHAEKKRQRRSFD